MDKQSPRQTDGSNSFKRKHGGEDVTAGKLISGGDAKRTRRESPLLEAKAAGNGPCAVTNSALGLLQEATARGTEDIQAVVAQQPGVAPPKNIPAVPTTEADGVTFPERLMELVMNETDKEALWWLPDGKAFAIHSKRFTKTILAKNFQGSKFESFTRKLARWGFKRRSGPDIPHHTFVFEHLYFQRSHPELAKKISGKKKKALPLTPSSLDDEAHLAAPAPAPWPTFQDQQHPVPETGRPGRGSLYNDLIRQTLLQQGLASTTMESSATSARADRTRRSSSSQSLQPDLENRLLQSMLNRANAAAESPARAQRQDALLTATLFAERERSRAFAAGTSTTTASPTTGPANTIDLAPMLNLPTLTGTNSLRRSLSTWYPIPSFGSSDSLTLPSIFQQQHQSTLPSSAALDPLVRLYLRQQHASRQDNLLLQQEVLRQEIRRREELQRDQLRRERADRGGALNTRT